MAQKTGEMHGRDHAATGRDPITGFATVNGHVIEDEGTPLTQRANLNFAGAGVTATDSGGKTLVTIPGGSSTDIGARVTTTAGVNQSIADSTWTNLAFPVELFDTDTIHDNATHNERLTCTTTGKYLIWGHALFSSNATGYRGLRFIDQSSFVLDLIFIQASTVIDTGLNLATVRNLSAGDWVTMDARQNSGGALDVLSGNYYSAQFGMTKLG